MGTRSSWLGSGSTHPSSSSYPERPSRFSDLLDLSRLSRDALTLTLGLCCGVATLFACDRDVPESGVGQRPLLHVLETRPVVQDAAFPLERAMRIRFDRYLRPASVVRQSVLVTPGMLDADGAPKGPVVFFEPVYDPYERMVVFTLQPGARWVPTTLHSVTFEPPDDESDMTGFSAFDGAPLAERTKFSFMTGDRVTDPNNDVDDVRPRVRFCETDDATEDLPAAYEVLRGCASAGCHGGEAPVFGLDLSKPSAIRDTAIRVAARQTLNGTSVGAPVANARRFGDDMPRLDPGNPGNSYLVYKLLVNPNNHPATGETMDEPDPWLGGLPPAGPPPLDELSRLRGWFVQGEPMPPNSSLRPDQMRSVIRWIMQGAETPECP